MMYYESPNYYQVKYDNETASFRTLEGFGLNTNIGRYINTRHCTIVNENQ